VAREQAMAIRLVGDGKSYAPQPSEDEIVDVVELTGPFPERTTLRLELPPGITDDVGRPLANAARFPLEVAVDESPPLARFSGEFGILELAEGGVLPVTLRNLEAEVAARRLPATGPVDGIPGAARRIDDEGAIARWIEIVRKAMEPRGEWEQVGDDEEEQRWKELTGSEPVLEQVSVAESFTLPKPGGGQAFEVVGIPLGKPGFYVVELASPRLGAALFGEERPRYVATTALVTNLAVHFEWGREASLVFVTSLDRGAPVPDAEIRVTDYCEGVELWRGRSAADGTVQIPAGTLPSPHAYGGCWESRSAPLLVSARVGEDLGFTVSSWADGITPSAFGMPTRSWTSPYLAHTVLDRTLFRAGETVSMKHYLRRHTSGGFEVPTDLASVRLALTHEGSGEQYDFDLAPDASGIAETTWAIPEEAALGRYLVRMRIESGEEPLVLESGAFRVEQYRVPTMRAVIQPPATALVNAESVALDLHVSYLSGGGAAGLPVKLRTLVEPRSVQHPDYEDYRFGGEDIVEGVSEEEVGSWDWFRQRGADESRPIGPARVLPLALDAGGAVRATVPDLPRIDAPHDLVAELEYQDANGELLTVAQRIALWPAAVQLGIRPEGWVGSAAQLRFRVVVLDLEGRPVAGRAVAVDLFTRTTYSYRKRLIGGFYAYENKTEVKRIDARCTGQTNPQGLLACDLEPGVSGSIVLRASAADEAGNRAFATREMWVAGDGDWWFGATAGDRMDVLPERNRYEQGEVARFQVRMPFRSATALVSVAREGVIDHFVTELSGKAPVVEVPIGDSYAPNVYVSVLAVRGRVGFLRSALADVVRRLDLPLALEGGLPTARIDLSKPAYRLGIARIDVGWSAHRLEVAVEPEGEAFKVRETARVRVKVRGANGEPPPAGGEIAFAAVDEGLLELSPNDSWALLEAMMNRRGLEVYASTAQMQVVGKRHYGRKAVAHGGGGGQEAARELFDTLLAWRGRLPLDADGSAVIEVPLNDSLTAYRLVAVASAGTHLFGSGSARIRTTQDLILHSGLPPIVREGDRYAAIFTVRNASERAFPVSASARIEADAAITELPSLELDLAPGEARELVFEATAPVGATRLEWEVAAGAADGSAQDRMRVSQEVIPAHPVRVYQATLAQLDPQLELTAARPPGAVPDRGGIEVRFRARLGDGLASVREYMQSYGYVCLEQQVSRAIALGDEELWRGIMRRLPAYLDRDGLLKYFPSEWLPGEDVLTAYVLAIGHEADYPIPESDRGRMLDALAGFVEGRIARESALVTADLAIRKLAAIGALARYGRAEAGMLGSVAIEPNLWPTSALIDWMEILGRVEGIAGAAARRVEAERILRARLDFQGTRMGFSTERDDALSWLMVSADMNAVRALLALIDAPAWREDLPRLALGALGRQQEGHWDTTTANAFGVLAIEKWSDALERIPVAGLTRAALGGAERDFEWDRGENEATFEFPWPEGSVAVTLTHLGSGKPWAFVTSRAALPLREPIASGYRIERSVTPIEQAQPGRWTRGDVARVSLAIDAQADMGWVVIDDPIPAGASILGSGLGRDSALLSAGEAESGDAWPAFVERRFEAWRAYYRFVPKGKLTVEYTVRLNNPGRYELPATRVEAMYAPEMFGELPNAAITVEPAP
jgi:hypothetical protein